MRKNSDESQQNPTAATSATPTLAEPSPERHASSPPRAAVDEADDRVDEKTGKRNSEDERREGDDRVDEEEGALRVPSDVEKGIAQRAKEKDGVIVVDWDGPDDPCDPRKCVLLTILFPPYCSTYWFVVVGRGGRNGRPRLSSPRSPSSRPCPHL